MKGKEILIGFAVVAILIGAIALVRSKKTSKTPKVPESLPSVEEKIEGAFNLTIPEDVAKIGLSAVADISGSGIATRKYEAGKFSHMVLADLPDPNPPTGGGSFYQGWLLKGDDTYLPSGKLQIAKGGYLLEFVYPTDLSSYRKVIISLEKVLGQKPTKSVLEGSF